MKLETQLFEKCKSMAYNCSLTYQSMNDFSVEIYTGYNTSYKKIFYTDGHIDKKNALKKSLKFLNRKIKMPNMIGYTPIINTAKNEPPKESGTIN
ncbi:hypothetical protein M0Q50_02200 [bacterium]|jgi:hypothetical protein|nr:hypothetical protein [bacterium]